MTLFYGQVIFQGRRIVADRPNDGDATPDSVPLAGYVDFVPQRSVNYDKADKVLKVIQTVTAGLDENGVLRDGQGNDSVTLVSPLSTDLQYQDWTWEAQFRLNDGVKIEPLKFALPPGQRKNLADIELLLDASTTAFVVSSMTDGQLGLSGDIVIYNDATGVYTITSNSIVDNADGTYSVEAVSV